MDEEATGGGGRDHLAAPRWTTPYPSRRRIIQDEESEEEQDEGQESQDKDHEEDEVHKDLEEDHAPFHTRGGTADATAAAAAATARASAAGHGGAMEGTTTLKMHDTLALTRVAEQGAPCVTVARCCCRRCRGAMCPGRLPGRSVRSLVRLVQQLRFPIQHARRNQGRDHLRHQLEPALHRGHQALQ